MTEERKVMFETLKLLQAEMEFEIRPGQHTIVKHINPRTSEKVTPPQKSPVLTRHKAPIQITGKTPAAQQPEQLQQHTLPPLTHVARRRSIRMPEDTQNWRVREWYFNKYTNKFGKFDVDACCDLGGHNRQVDRFWSNCLGKKWRGLRVWYNPPYNSSHIAVDAILYKYIQEWWVDPEHTSAVFILPDLQSKEGTRMAQTFRTGRDNVSQHSDPKFLRALKSEYIREGTLRKLKDKVKAAPTSPCKDFKLDRLELAQQRQRERFDRRHGQREYAVEDLVWVDAKTLTEKVMDRSICRKLTKRWHGPVLVVERFFSDMQMVMPEADMGAPVAYTASAFPLTGGYTMCPLGTASNPTTPAAKTPLLRAIAQ
ncbi:hypothetical protein CYMTET_19802 [Cymbomonas tetramitiformis]|uniref:Uncharacterized protein n=1 Tax=Cymbomonas tetramitiformis TaxID=36881 RepID=A0AAE0G5E5_9CHLO|nr:hypothetical protein CYMTET_19802 [Cymbomonas tetramitiformis]